MKPVQTPCFTELRVIGEDSANYSSKSKGGKGGSFLLPLSFVPVIILHLRANSPLDLAGGDI